VKSQGQKVSNNKFPLFKGTRGKAFVLVPSV
jgi:hypothetical protein